jgi:cytosine/adenosine deaminase-related metal-dependent hydrolase
LASRFDWVERKDSTDGTESRPYLMIIRSRIVVPMVGEPINNGAIAIVGNVIAGVGRFEDVKANHGGDVLDLGEQIVLPGLINAHCHLDYTLLRGQIPPQKSFTDWIRAINSHKAALSEEDYIASIGAGLAEVQKFGTTSLLNLEAFPELLPRISRPPLRAWWCAEMIDVRERVPVHEVSENLHNWFEAHPEWLGGFALAPHAPFTASAQLFAAAAEISRKYHVPVTTHVAESREEMQMFRDANGSLFDFLKSIGRQLDDCGSSTPFSSLTRGHAVDERWILAHLNELTEGDFDLLTRAKKFHIAHCPRSHAFFGHTPFELRRLQTLGFNICLGTDSLASNSSLSLFSEMRELLRKEPWISPREVLTMATVNGAHAIGRADSLGRISPGFCADLIAIPSAETGRSVFDAIVTFEGTIPWIMVNGDTLSLL